MHPLPPEAENFYLVFSIQYFLLLQRALWNTCLLLNVYNVYSYRNAIKPIRFMIESAGYFSRKKESLQTWLHWLYDLSLPLRTWGSGQLDLQQAIGLTLSGEFPEKLSDIRGFTSTLHTRYIDARVFSSSGRRTRKVGVCDYVWFTRYQLPFAIDLALHSASVLWPCRCDPVVVRCVDH